MPPYSTNIPEKVWGLSDSQHTKEGLQRILTHANYAFNNGDKKRELHERVAILEARLHDDDAEDLGRIVEDVYFQERRLLKREHDLVNLIRGLAIEDQFHPRSRNVPTSWYQYIDELRLTREWESEDEHMDEVGILVYSNGPSTVYQPDRTCKACMKKLIGNKFPQRGITSACDHDAAICLECLEESIKSQLPQALKCQLCLKVMELEDIQR